MMRRLLAVIATLAMLAALSTVPAAAVPGFGLVDIDSPEDCEVPAIGVEQYTNGQSIHVTINRNWIIAICHARLTDDEVSNLGGPFDQAMVFRGFDCTVGDDNETYDDVPATRSHMTVTPSNWMHIVCKAPVPNG